MPMYEEQCNKCGRKIESYKPAATGTIEWMCDCGGVMELVYSVPSLHIWTEYTTNNIHKDGSPVTVRSQQHERDLLKQNGLVKADSELPKH